MKPVRILTISLIFLFSFNITCFSQGNWKVFTKNSDPSIPRGFVNTTFEDNENNFWVGTNLGLFMYNGSKWKQFKKEDGLIGDFVTKLVQDSKGVIWIGTNKGLSTYKDGELTAKKQKDKIKFFSKSINIFPQYYISNIYEDSKENIWFGTGLKKAATGTNTFGFVFKYDGEKCTFIKSKTKGYPIIDIMEDNDGHIWIASAADYRRVQASSHSYVYTYRGNLVQYKDGKWKNYIGKIRYNGIWSIDKIYKDKKGNLWFSAISNNYDGCVIKYNGEEMRILDGGNGLLNYVNVYFEDSNGILWFGGDSGLAYTTNDKYQFLRNNSNEIINLYVNTIREDSKKNIWIGTSKGIYVYTNEGTWKQFHINNGLSGDSNNTLRIGEDFEGKMWVLTKGQVKHYISKINPENWSIESIPTDTFIASMSYNLVEASNKDLWFIANGQVIKYLK
jgi:ligand-binding sensor domain-containing protein